MREPKMGPTQFKTEVERLKAAGKMPSLEEVLAAVAEQKASKDVISSLACVIKRSSHTKASTSLCVRLPARSRTSICCREERRMSVLFRVGPEQALMPLDCAPSPAFTTSRSGFWRENKQASSSYPILKDAALELIKKAAEHARSPSCCWRIVASTRRLQTFCRSGERRLRAPSAQESLMQHSSSSLRALRLCVRLLPSLTSAY
jgi:hypothetical protein